MVKEIPEFKFCLDINCLEKLCEHHNKKQSSLGNSVYLKPKHFLPTKAYNTDTGWDVRSAQDIFLYDYEYFKIPLGFKVFSPPGWWLKLAPRSSTFAKKHLNALYGVIDETYSGTCYFGCQFQPDRNDGLSSPKISFGEKIGQLIPFRRKEMLVTQVNEEEFDKLCQERNAKRGSGGFGSTD